MEQRFYLSSLPPDADALLVAVRSHWGVENSGHWCLDVTFDEDGCRIRMDAVFAKTTRLSTTRFSIVWPSIFCAKNPQAKRDSKPEDCAPHLAMTIERGFFAVQNPNAIALAGILPPTFNSDNLIWPTFDASIWPT